MKKVTNESLKTVRERERERESSNLKNGITLIALVITIVVLIILAGVAINLTLGDSGIFNKAKYAKEKYLNAKDDEDIELARIKNQIEQYLENTRDNEIQTTLLYPAVEDNSYAGDSNVTYSLNNSYKNYKYLLVEAECMSGNSTASGTTTILIPTNNIILTDTHKSDGSSHTSWSMWVADGKIYLHFKSETSFGIGPHDSGRHITHIYGLN